MQPLSISRDTALGPAFLPASNSNSGCKVGTCKTREVVWSLYPVKLHQKPERNYFFLFKQGKCPRPHPCGGGPTPTPKYGNLMYRKRQSWGYSGWSGKLQKDPSVYSRKSQSGVDLDGRPLGDLRGKIGRAEEIPLLTKKVPCFYIITRKNMKK